MAEQEKCPTGWSIGFDPAGKDGGYTAMVISNADGTITHHSRNWETTASYLAFALMETADLEAKLAETREEYVASLALATASMKLGLDRRDDIDKLQAENAKLREALVELVEVAELRGDDDLPHPCQDPGLWTARMQTAWDEAHELVDMPARPKGGEGKESKDAS